MARPVRIEYPGAIYHITSRGNERKEIFRDDADRERFVRLLENGADSLKVEVIAYCLMPNHFHLLLQTREANLSRFMQRLNTSYTIHFNHKYKRVGHLLQGRYKAILVESNNYYLSLSRYIHLNPVQVKKFEQKNKVEKMLLLKRYRWSSYQSVLEPSTRLKCLSPEKVLDVLGGDTSENRKKYEKYVSDGINSKAESVMGGVKYQLLLGADGFIEHIKTKYLKKIDVREHNSKIRDINIDNLKSINEIAKAVAEKHQISEDEILNIKSKNKEARKLLVTLSYESNVRRKSLREIGKELGGLSGPGVMRVYERFVSSICLPENLKLKQIYQEIKDNLSIV